MRAIAQHHQPAWTLDDLAIVERCLRRQREQHDRVATPRSHAAIVPISGGQRKALYVQGGGKRRGDGIGRSDGMDVFAAPVCYLPLAIRPIKAHATNHFTARQAL
jgi:hypothetical protein